MGRERLTERGVFKCNERERLISGGCFLLGVSGLLEIKLHRN